MMVLKLAIKNLLLQRKRYTLMTIAVATGFFLITLLSALSQGAIDTVRLKAARYFSGQICVYDYTGDDRDVQNPDFYVNLLKESRIPIEIVSKRSILQTDSNSLLFFNGSYVNIRKVIGVDFETEKEQLERLPFIEGGIGNGALISRAITEDLGAKVGDSITLNSTTSTGQVNTMSVPISGIFDELNIFGYAVYMDIEEVNTLANFPKDYVSEIAVYTEKGANINKAERDIIELLSKYDDVHPVIKTRSEFITAINAIEDDQRIFIVAQSDTQLDQITLLLDAFSLCTYFILVIFMLITAVGIINTYRVIIHNRTNEIGTMRAIGIHKKTIVQLFLTEAVLLSFIASTIGFVLAVSVLPITNFIQITGVPAINMFTEFGRLQYTIRLDSVLANMVLITISIVIAVLGPSKTASTISPADALRNI